MKLIDRWLRDERWTPELPGEYVPRHAKGEAVDLTHNGEGARHARQDA